jgi:hypothetical protein
MNQGIIKPAAPKKSALTMGFNSTTNPYFISAGYFHAAGIETEQCCL